MGVRSSTPTNVTLKDGSTEPKKENSDTPEQHQPIGLTVIKKVETFAYDGKFRRTRGDGGEGVFKPLTRRDFFA